MEKQTSLLAQLCSSIEAYRDAIVSMPGEEREDFLRVAGHADSVVRALETNDAAKVKLSLYAVSRQVTDSFFSQPQEFKELSQNLRSVEKYIFGSQ